MSIGSKPKIGILGAGSIAHLHARCWQRMPNAELVGYYDVIPEAAARFSQSYGGQAYSNLDAFLDAIDIVDICTPGTIHKENVLAAAAAGVPIICEKPLARHLADCQEMIDACARANVPLYVAHVVRFFPQYAKAKELLEAGQLGRPGVIRTVRTGSFPGFNPKNTYYGDFTQSGGVILDVAIHDIDYQRWCFGEVERVFARGLSFADIEKCDHALITLRFANGAIGHIEGSWAHPAGQFRTRLELTGDQGLAEWDSLDRQAMQVALKEDGQVDRHFASPTASEDDPYYQELAHFVDCIVNDATPRVTAHDALMAVKIALAAIESVRTGQVVEIAKFAEG